MPPSIAEGPDRTPLPSPAARRFPAWLAGLCLAVLALALYAASNPQHWNAYNHFVWQADAFLHGRAWFPYPVYPGAELPQNWYLQDVYPVYRPDGSYTGGALLPFPPLPALVLLPFVAVSGLAADQEAVAIGLGALGVALAWWMLGGLRIRTSVRAVTTAILATGTVWWWAAAAGSTWYLAHLVATDVALVAVGVALRNDPRAAGGPLPGEAGGDGPEPSGEPEAGEPVEAATSGARADTPRAVPAGRSRWRLDRSQVLVGLLLGIAVTARLPMILGAPFFILAGGGGSWVRRLVSAGVGGLLPVAALLAFTFLTTGSVVHPGYDYQYRREVEGYPALGYDAAWSLEDVRYIPRNLGIMLGSFPAVLPDVLPNTLHIYADVPVCTEPGAQRSLFDRACPLAVPVDLGTSLLLSAPGLLLAPLALRRYGRSRLAVGAIAAVLPVAAFNLAHFSQGWVQWGYRFSLDFLPFVLPLMALGAARPSDGRVRQLALALLVVGGLANLWGVTWGQILAW